MSLPKPSGMSAPPLDAVKGRPINMKLPAYRGVERRNVARREAHVRRLVSEFQEMPGLRLSLEQVSRLIGLTEAATGRILDGLIQAGTLRRNARNLYVRGDRST